MKTLKTRRTALACLLGSLAIGLAACGGGGSDSTGSASTSGSTSPDDATVSVTPAMGAFGAGATVKLYKPDGTLLGTAITASDGKATVAIGAYAGPFIAQVQGAPGVLVFNEKTGKKEEFGSTDILLAVVPGLQTAAGASIGVTPLTHAAAVQLVSDLVTPLVAGTPSEAAQGFVLANARIQASVGIDPASFDILTAPEALADVTDRLSTQDTAPQAARYGAYLAALALASTAPNLKEKTRLLAEDAAFDGKLEQHGTLIKETIEQLLTVRDTYTSGAEFGADLSAQVVAMQTAKPDQAMTGAAAAKPDQPLTEAEAQWEARNSAAQTALTQRYSFTKP